MGRFPFPRATRGSQRWIQELVNDRQDLIDGAIGLGPIKWLSPLASDDYAEYRDTAALARLGTDLKVRPLSEFWPAHGPQWDGLGRAESGELILVEAKAHIPEVLSPPSQASQASLALIKRSLSETADALGAAPSSDWTTTFYQIANRLAHGYLLAELNLLPAKLVFLYFIGDREMEGPASRQEWEAALAVVRGVMGLKAAAPPYVIEAFVDVGPLQ